MGFGFPSAIGAQFGNPDKKVWAVVGDGGFQMTGLEFSVAVERNLPIRVFASNNGSLGTIRLYQEKSYPDRTIATDLPSLDITKFADAYGAKGLRIESDDEMPSVVAEALAHDGPVLIDVRTSLEYIAAYTTISDIRS